MTMPARRSESPLPVSDVAEFRRRLDEAREFHLSRLEVGDDLGSDDIAMAMARRSEASLVAVEAALERIDGGSYGVCEVCGGQISAERLDAVPHTDVCVHCVGAIG
ncbi:MAG: TraR/DksA family transcriptional regulator [Acidimicrobiia bacterium]